eukprot:2617023-Amphidinium_carterae.2
MRDPRAMAPSYSLQRGRSAHDIFRMPSRGSFQVSPWFPNNGHHHSVSFIEPNTKRKYATLFPKQNCFTGGV